MDPDAARTQYDQSQQHHPYYPQIPQQQQYPNPNPNPNPNPDPNAVYQHHHPDQEHAQIHPPGVPVYNDSSYIAAYQQAYDQAYYSQHQQQLSYPDAGMLPQGQHQGQRGLIQAFPPNGQHRGPSRGGGRASGRGRGSSFRGRGRGGGRGSNTIKSEPKPQFLAWCELCRVDCNTHEVLENHKNGKKHKKNLKTQQDLQKLAARTQETQMAAAAAAIERPEVKLESQPMQKSEEQQVKKKKGLKRKNRDEKRKPVDHPEKKAKEMVPFVCELCRVKCESAPTFDSHLNGRKHGFNLQRFHEQQNALGHVALQAIVQALAQNGSTSYPNGGFDQQALLQLLQPYLPQTGPAVLTPVQGPEPVPGPGLEPVGPNPGVTHVEPVVEAGVKAEDQVEPESKTEQVDSKAVEPELTQ